MAGTIHARRMSGSPHTLDGQRLPLASWYELDAPDSARAGVHHLVITNHGVYPCDALGYLTDFDHVLASRHVGKSPEAELEILGYELAA